MSRFISIVAAAAVAIAAPAGAESIKMTAVFPAPNPQVAIYRVLGVDNFSGREGRQMQMELERRLTKEYDGEPAYFYLVGDGAAPEAIVGGDASSRVTETPYRGKEEVCVARDAAGKCTAKAIQPVNCMRRVVDFSVFISVTDNTDGQIVFSERYPRQNTMTWCGSQQPYASIDQTLQGMIHDIAKDFRKKTTMRSDDYGVRLREDTKGATPGGQVALKEWLKLSKQPAIACDPQAMPLVGFDGEAGATQFYNSGVCYEFRGEYHNALADYRDALARDPDDSKIRKGIERATELLAASELAKKRGS